MCVCIMYSLIVPLGMYTLPDEVRTRQEGSKSLDGSPGVPARRPFSLLIVGLRGGTSGGRGTPSSKQPAQADTRTHYIYTYINIH